MVEKEDHRLPTTDSRPYTSSDRDFFHSKAGVHMGVNRKSRWERIILKPKR